MRRLTEWLGRWLAVVIVAGVGWRFTLVVRSADWVLFGINVAFLFFWVLLAYFDIKRTLFYRRRVVMHPIPFPVPDPFPKLGDLLNDVQTTAEAAAEQMDLPVVPRIQVLIWRDREGKTNGDLGDD